MNIINTLNSLLEAELLGIRQYLINGLKFKFHGYKMLAEKFLEEASESGEGTHVDILVKRILILGGKINCNKILECQISDNIEDVLKYSLELEKKLSLIIRMELKKPMILMISLQQIY